MIARILVFSLQIVLICGDEPVRSPFPDLLSQYPGFQKECLDRHNYYRAKHLNTPLLKTDNNIVSYAQSRCKTVSTYEYLDENHDGVDDSHGENLFWGGYSVKYVYNCTQAVDNWYAEIADYDYKNPEYDSNTGHFTQLVWNTTTSLGCDLCGGQGEDWYETYIVCDYQPPGNYIGQFAQHVNKPK